MVVPSPINARAREILRLRYATTGGEALPRREIGRRFAITGERVRQIELASLAKLQELRFLARLGVPIDAQGRADLLEFRDVLEH